MPKPLSQWLNWLLGSRFWALFQKEFAQIRHNRQLLIQLIVPPTVMLIFFGFALDPDVQNLKLGITDYSNTPASRDFIQIFQQTDAFVLDRYYTNQQEMLEDLARGDLSLGVVIPPEFASDLARDRPAQVQAIFDAVNTNLAGTASNYLNQLVNDYNRQIRSERTAASGRVPRADQLELQTSVFYNPGLRSSWFIVSGMIGMLLTIIGSQSAASLVVREKEAGTIEQLMMAPASSLEVIFSKVTPLIVILTFDALLELFIAQTVFKIPLRGNLPLFLMITILYFWVGLGIGILVGTTAKGEQQAQLIAFFINPPLVLTSGASTPITAMPPVMQALTYLNPLRYYIEVCRGILLKGVGLGTLWLQVLILMGFAIVLMTLSIRQFRRQLT